MSQIPELAPRSTQPSAHASCPRGARIRGSRLLLRGLGISLLLSFGSGCVSTVDGGWGIPPLFESYSREPSSASSNDGYEAWALRPLTLFEREGDRTDLSILWPFYRRTVQGESSRSWILPVWYRSRRVEPTGGVDSDNLLFPFLFFGNEPAEGSYFLFFPFGGRLKGILGQDQTDWFLFPLYVQAQDRERVSTHLLWPVVNWIDGPHHDGWRIFPFYGRYTATTPDGTPKYDRRFYLWPFFHFHENNLDTQRPARTWWLWPLFGKIESENLTRYSFLWPLYTFVRKGDSTTVALPVLPIIWTRGPELEQTDLWPIYGLKKNRTPGGTSYRQFFLWPIQRYHYSSNRSTISESFWFLPIFWHHRYRDIETGVERSSTRLWPLFSNRLRADGTRVINAIDILPFDEDPRFDRLYARWWRFYRYVDRGEERGSDWEFLWGLLRGGRGREGTALSFLGGLIERDSRKGTARWRLLYIPF